MPIPGQLFPRIWHTSLSITVLALQDHLENGKAGKQCEKRWAIIPSHAWKVWFDRCISFSWVHAACLPSRQLSIINPSSDSRYWNERWRVDFRDAFVLCTLEVKSEMQHRLKLLASEWWHSPFWKSTDPDPRWSRNLVRFSVRCVVSMMKFQLSLLKSVSQGGIKKKGMPVCVNQSFFTVHDKSVAQEYTAHYDRGTGNSEDITMGFAPRAQGDCGHCKGAADLGFNGNHREGQSEPSERKGNKGSIENDGFEWIWMDMIWTCMYIMKSHVV